MKKIVKLSLIAAVSLATAQTLSADSIAQAFQDGKVSGELKSQYFQKETGTSSTEVSIWTNGGNLSYETGSFYGLKAGVTFQAATVTASSLKGTDAYDKDQNVSGAVMSQAYLEYTRENTIAKVGRQYISTPLVAGSGSRIFKEAFEGIVVSNTDIANTTVVAAYVSKEQYRTDIAAGGTTVKDVSDFEKLQDGAYTLYVKNNSVENLTLDAQYAQIKTDGTQANDKKAFYASASYDLNNVTIAAQTYQTDNGLASNSDGKAYGINVSTNIDNLSLAAAYATVDKDADIVNGIGNGADGMYTASWINGGFYSADTDSYKLSAGYKVTNDLSLDLMHASWKTGTAQRASETDYVASYSFDKNLSATFVFADFNNTDSGNYQSRLYVSYKF